MAICKRLFEFRYHSWPCALNWWKLTLRKKNNLVLKQTPSCFSKKSTGFRHMSFNLAVSVKRILDGNGQQVSHAKNHITHRKKFEFSLPWQMLKFTRKRCVYSSMSNSNSKISFAFRNLRDWSNRTLELFSLRNNLWKNIWKKYSGPTFGMCFELYFGSNS